MKPLLSLTSIALICLATTTANAQTDSLKTTNLPLQSSVVKASKKTTATIFAGAVYAPKLHYYGRTDTLRSSALLPTVLIQFDSAHLYVSATSVLLSNKVQSMLYAGTIAEAGLRFGQLKGFAGNIYANKFFYNTTQLPQSALKEQAGINLNYLTTPINITTSASAAFSNRTDFFIAAGLNHSFKWRKEKSVFVITPTAVVNAGSQNFTNAYYKGNAIPGLGGNDVVTENNRRFKVLSYEFSTPIVWAYKRLYVIATPTYVLPKNIVTVPGFPQYSERASDLFFVNLTALYSIKL